jgi:hypothetical protein
VIAGVAAAIISHPADTLLSKVNKAGAGGDGPILTRLGRIASEIGFYKLCTVGLAARCVMIGKLLSFIAVLFHVFFCANLFLKLITNMWIKIIDVCDVQYNAFRNVDGRSILAVRRRHGHHRRREVPFPQPRGLRAPLGALTWCC